MSGMASAKNKNNKGQWGRDKIGENNHKNKSLQIYTSEN